MSNTPATQLTNPFVGLRAFEESEDYLFFGRGKQIDELLKKLNDSRFLAVIGSSGSGKSSLVKSGLLPAIYSGFMTVGSNWRVVLMRPGENPIGYLTNELATEGTLHNNTDKDDIPYSSIIESSLRRSENGLVQVYKDAHLPPNENLLIVVDQFEELFRFSKYEKENKLGKSDALHFIQILLTAAQQKECPIYVLLTMRSDFLGDCAEFRGLPEAINQGQYLVPRMKRDEIREAITGPVAVSEATIAQRLVTRLLNDIGNNPDQLPILQHAMMRTWDAWYKRNKRDLPIDFEDYDKIGGMKAALSQHADEVYAEFKTEKDQKICELMFKALTDKAADVRGIRRPRSIADLCVLTGGTQAEVINQVEIFRKTGRTFLMPPLGIALTGKSIIDISHESLMRVWNRLIKWTEEEARSGDVYVRLANAAHLKEQGLTGLLRNPELEIALKWYKNNNPTAKWAEGYHGNFEQAIGFLLESQKESILEIKLAQQRSRTKKRLALAVIILLGLVVIGGSFLLKKTNDQKKIAEEATKAAIKAQLSDSIARVNAEMQKAIAIGNLAIADSAKKVAMHNDTLAQVAVMEARYQKYKADQKAEDERKAKEEAEKEKAIALKQNLKIAANEYARLIREGPTEESKIKKEEFDYKLIAYCNHLDTLGPITSPDDTEAYNALLEKLYYNNDLYEKLYYCFESHDAVGKILAVNNNLNPDFNSKLFVDENGQKNSVKLSGGEIKFVSGGGHPDVIVTPQNEGQKFTSFAISNKLKRIFCATDDNLIAIYQLTTEGDLKPVNDKISLGAKVTALDYNDDENIIYFGTANGDIGFIKYNIDKKNQPVYENALGSKITAIQFFKSGNKSYLLATGLRSKPVVYELDNNSSVPDKKLSGNVLPKKNLGDVNHAAFDYSLKQVILQTSKAGMETTYLWNPFTADLLDSLKITMQVKPQDKNYKKLIDKMNDPKIKFY